MAAQDEGFLSFDFKGRIINFNFFLNQKMKKQTLFILAMASIGLFSCKNISGKENVEAVVDSLKVDSIAVVTPIVDEIVKDSVTNPKGETLQMLFNNTTSTATFTLKNEVDKENYKTEEVKLTSKIFITLFSLLFS